MYWGYPVIYRQTFQPVRQTTFQQALALIREAVQGERNDELFYEELIRLHQIKHSAISLLLSAMMNVDITKCIEACIKN
jgi:hypothetical protein